MGYWGASWRTAASNRKQFMGLKMNATKWRAVGEAEARIRELEQRIRELEAENAELNRELDGVVLVERIAKARKILKGMLEETNYFYTGSKVRTGMEHAMAKALATLEGK